MILKASIYQLIFLGLFFFVGCDRSTPEAKDDAGLASKSPTELVKSALNETDEIKFCLSEDAGIDSFEESADRLFKIIEAASCLRGCCHDNGE